MRYTIFFLLSLNIYSQSEIERSSQSISQKISLPTYTLNGQASQINQIKEILNKYEFIESSKGEYNLEINGNSLKIGKRKNNITLNSYNFTENWQSDFISLIDSEGGYYELIGLKNNGNNDFKLSDLFTKAELGKEGAKVGESIELEFVYRSKNKKNAFLTIFLFTTDGMIAQIFPNKYDPDNLLQPNDNYKFPTTKAKKPYKLEASTPVGNDRLILILTEKPLLLNAEKTKAYGHLTVLIKDKKSELKRIKEELLNLSSYCLQEIILNIRE